MLKNKAQKFALIGVGGYIAPRHLKAMQDTNCELLAAVDKHDSVGILDSYFPNAAFFTEFERFDRHVEKLKSNGNKIDYLTVCSPNYLHDAHIRFGLRYGADVICEKPLVLNPWNAESLKEVENSTDQKVYTILQLRLHPSIIELKRQVDESPKDKVFECDLTYITTRGNWYYTSWKGDLEKSGGIATNIGIHFFDMLNWIFGDYKEHRVHIHTHDRAAGYIEFPKAKVRWFLSINEETLPNHIREVGKKTYRSVNIGGEELEFSDGFVDLHTESYEKILNGEGFRIDDVLKSIEIVHEIRNKELTLLVGDYHPLCKLPLSNHPFKK